MARKKQWMRTTRAPQPAPDELEKAVIVAACEAFIRDVLKPRFLPEINPTEWNYVIDIHGAWAAGHGQKIANEVARIIDEVRRNTPAVAAAGF